jgi:hypothetical protein
VNLAGYVKADIGSPLTGHADRSSDPGTSSPTALSLIGHELASDLHAPRQLLYSPLEFGALHDSILGQMCPHVKLKIWLTPFSETVALERVVVKLRMFGGRGSAELPARYFVSLSTIGAANHRNCQVPHR